MIENGSTWLSKNRVSPMFAKERKSAHAHHSTNLKSTGQRGQMSVNSNTSNKSTSGISRNEPMGN